MLALDTISQISCMAILGVFMVPVLIIFCLPGRKGAIPIAGVTFWVWLVLAGELIRDADPSYDSFGPAINFLFGLPFGLGYSTIWFLIGKLWKPRRHSRRSYALSAACWLLVAIGCGFFPFAVAYRYHRSVVFYLEYTLPPVVPLFALCVAMVVTSLRQWVELGRELPVRADIDSVGPRGPTPQGL